MLRLMTREVLSSALMEVLNFFLVRVRVGLEEKRVVVAMVVVVKVVVVVDDDDDEIPSENPRRRRRRLTRYRSDEDQS